MSHGPRRLPRLPLLLPTGPAADVDLLARWVVHRDEIAFELLVRRHAPLVLAICRRILSDPNDSDDAFQAAFLVLARKASSVARGEMLAAWLHRVACRAAFRIRAERAKRAGREESGVEQLPSRRPPDPVWRELECVLDEEISRLPERQRAAFVLCCLEGKTGEEAGCLLGCPAGTVSSRLTRAREQLRVRLTRRGFSPGIAAAFLAALAGDSIAATSAALVESTLVVSLAFASEHALSAGYPANRPATIAQGVIRSMTTTKLKIAALVVAAGLLAAGGVFATTRPGEEPSQPLPAPKTENAKLGVDEKRPAPPVVRVARPQAGGLDRLASQVATAEPVQQAQLVPAVTGSLRKVNVDIGDQVKGGQILAEIDAPALDLDERQATIGVEQAKGLLNEAEARLVTARAEIEAGKSAVKQREAEMTAAKVNLAYRKKQLERLKELFKQGTIDTRIVDEAEDYYLSAEAKVAAALEAVENAKADVAVKQSKLLQAEAAVAGAKSSVDAAKLGLEKARLAVSQTKLHAPFDGVVTRRTCSSGDYVRPSDRGDASLFTVMRIDTVRVVVAVAERDIPLVKPGVPAEVTFDSLPGIRVVGKVARVGFAVDPTNRTMRAEIDVPNPKGDIRPGMFGSVALVLEKGPADAVRIPLAAVVTLSPLRADEKMNATVYVYRDGKARLTRVRIEKKDGREAEVLSGLSVDDRVVVNPAGLPKADEVPVEIEKPAPK